MPFEGTLLVYASTNGSRPSSPVRAPGEAQSALGRPSAKASDPCPGPCHFCSFGHPDRTAGFLKACEEMGHEVLEGVNAPVRDGAGFMDFIIKDGRRFSVVHGYLLPALERQNLTLLTGTRVDALSFQGSRCTGVRFRIGAEQFEVKADKETVLCAGAIESPRLLMLSGAGNAEELRRYGITTVSNLPGVGENLQDHPFITAFAAETKAPMAAASRAESQLFFRSTKEASTPDIHALLGAAVVGIPQIKPNEAFSIRLGLLRPQSRGRIKITSADINAPLLIDPNYLSAGADLTARPLPGNDRRATSKRTSQG